MEKNPIIFYGAGRDAEIHLSRWIDEGFEPVCFADSDESLHGKSFPFNPENPRGGRYEILPLKEATRRWPDYKIFISVVAEPYSVYQDLLALGIPDTRILRYSAPKYCPEYLGKYLVIHGPGVQSCCHTKSFRLPPKGNFKDDLAQYYERCEQLREALKAGLFTTCSGCELLEDEYADVPAKINSVNVSSGLPGGDSCSFKCCYCTYGGHIGKYRYKENILEIIRQISELVKPEKMTYASGEITVSPYRDEILELWEKNSWEGVILTNGAVYNEKIAEIIARNRVTLKCSIDAGTKNTFARVKGADCYEKVLDNLRKYALTGGVIELKYILLEGINDNEADIDGFVEFAGELKSNVVFSRDSRVRHQKMTENGYSMLLRFREKCREQRIDFSLTELLMLPDRDQLKADDFIGEVC